MAYEFRLPDIGEGVIEGEIVRWLVKEGDALRLDQPMVEVMTDKATVEIPSPRAGTVLQRMFAEGKICPVGQVLIRIEEQAGALAGNNIHETGRGRARKSIVPPGAIPSTPIPTTGTTTVLATPATRKLARELGVDISTLPATGPAGRVTSDDVHTAASAHNRNTAIPPAPRAAMTNVEDVRIPFRGMRRTIADRLIASKHKAAHFTYVEEVDATALVALREKANTRLGADGVKISYLPFIIKAVVDALKRFPQLNATLDEAAGEIVQRRSYHIGIASATEAGLVVPVVKNADQMSLVHLARETQRLAKATKDGKATREDLTGSTFTITSLGTLGGLHATPIINFPEVAILAIHKIEKRAVVVDDKVTIRERMNLSISVDHRLVDGHEAASFVAVVKESLETPGLMFLDSV